MSGCSTAASPRSASAPAWRCFGVVPFFAEAALLPAEDSMALRRYALPTGDCCGRLALTCGGGDGKRRWPESRSPFPLLPRIANFDDLDPLRAEPAVELVMVPPGQPLPRDAALVILPGSKATLADLAVPAARGLGHRHPRASPPGRARAGPVRRLSDARPAHRRSGRARRAARRGGGARAARHRDGARPATSGSAKPPGPISRPA